MTTTLLAPGLSARIGWRIARRMPGCISLVFAASFGVASSVHAQASAVGTVAPPARADMALSGKVVHSSNVSDAPACQSECQQTKACSGYSFDRNAKANCTLLTGTLTDAVLKGAVSCRMPCEPSPRASVLPARALATTLRDPAATVLVAPLSARTVVPTPPPVAPAPAAAAAPLQTLPAGLTKTPVDLMRPVGKAKLIQQGGTAELPPPPLITSVRLLNMVSASFLARVGNTIVVQGSGFTGLSSVKLSYAKQVNGVWLPNPAALRSYTAATTEVTATSLKFVIPEVDLGINNDAPLVVTLSRGNASATGTDVILVVPTPTARKIISVQQLVVRAGGRIRITGMGFNGVPGGGGYNGVVGGYFGVGTPGSVSNPLISVANLSATYVELWLPQTCNMEGILMLTAPRVGGGSDDLVVATPPITVACLQTEPSGRIAGTETAPNGVITVQPGSSIIISGTGLRHVTQVVDQTNQVFAFTYTQLGSGPSAREQLAITLPATSGRAYSFYLNNKLTDPVLAGRVSGIVQTVSP